jgi:hypothetical protein
LAYLAFGIAIDAGNRIVISGATNGIDVVEEAVATRLMPNGALDETFGVSGTVTFGGFGRALLAGMYSGVKPVGSAYKLSDSTPCVIRVIG